MVQVKKNEVKQGIEDAAIDIFFEKGYLYTKMSYIAEKACVSVGNIYRYFKNKDELFYTIVPQYFADSFKKCNINMIIDLNMAIFDNLKNIDDCILIDEHIELVIENRKKLIILLRRSEGTKYENFKNELLSTIIEYQKINLQKLNLGELFDFKKNNKLVRILLENMLNMLLDALKDEMDIKERKYIIKFINKYYIYGLKKLLQY
jgi:AcrR family transcriptional regulator